MIAVGIVHHQEMRQAQIEASGPIAVTHHVNADRKGRTPWRSFAANHNDLMTRAQDATWYIALNPDVSATPDALLALVGAAEENELSIAAPLLTSPWGVVNAPRSGFPLPEQWLTETHSRDRRRRVHSESPVQSSSWVSGACIAIRIDREPLRFDERYFLYFEDVDLCFRAHKLGHQVGVCTNVVMQHDSGWSSGDKLRWRRGVEFARAAMHFADVAGSSRSAMRIAGLLRYGSRLALPNRSEPERVAGQAICRGLANPSAAGLSELAQEFNRALAGMPA